jgi:hypothetical protein
MVKDPNHKLVFDPIYVRTSITKEEAEFLAGLDLSEAAHKEVDRVWRMDQQRGNDGPEIFLISGAVIFDLLMLKLGWFGWIFSSDFMVFAVQLAACIFMYMHMQKGLLHLMNGASSNKDFLFSHESMKSAFRDRSKDVMEGTLFTLMALMLSWNGYVDYSYAVVAVFFWERGAERILRLRIQSKFREIETESTLDRKWSCKPFV